MPISKYFSHWEWFGEGPLSVCLSLWALLRSVASRSVDFDAVNSEIYPLKIHLTEIMYRMMWEYFFQRNKTLKGGRKSGKVSTTAGLSSIKKGSSSHESLVLSSQSAKDYEVFTKSSTSGLTDSSQVPKLPNLKESMVSGSKPELRRTSSFDRTWEETVAESVANELVLQAHSSSSKSSSFKPA
ncbi:hypothetical protein Leryth_009148 [Lithospermum erythrorhizon]|nr:hypothetical protein Leryth_009148 [Lithospermum erythrorhizon]